MADAISQGNEGTAPPPSTAAGQSPHNWKVIENSSDFSALLRRKRNVIVSILIFFAIYYFGFLIFVGYFPDLASIKVFGNFNIAYLFALSQFFVTWFLMYLYVRQANSFDRQAQQILENVRGGKYE